MTAMLTLASYLAENARTVHERTSVLSTQSASRTVSCVTPATRTEIASSAAERSCAWSPQTSRTTSTSRDLGANATR